MSRCLKILLLIDVLFPVTRGYDFSEDFKTDEMKVYADIYRALIENGHTVSVVGLYDSIEPLLAEIDQNCPDLVFNQADMFCRRSDMDKNIAALLELLGVRHTGADHGLLYLCNDKALSKTVLNLKRIRVPGFKVFYKGKKVRVSKRLRFPLIVKPLCEEASRGISKGSFVQTREEFLDRVKFIHENMHKDAIAEEYVKGREFYVSMLGRSKISVLPLREVKFLNVPDDEPTIATYRAKWDDEYRKKWGIKNVFAGKLSEGWEENIKKICKRAYRAMNIKSYARFDVRVADEGDVYIIEANANPSLERDDEFVLSAHKAGISYDKLIQRIVELALC